MSVGLIIKLKCSFVFPLSDIEFMFAISVNLHQSGLVVCQPTMLLQIEIFQQLFDLHENGSIIHGAQRRNSNVFGYPLTFYQVKI